MKKSRNILKEYFERGDIPNQAQFIDLIDGYFHEVGSKVIPSIDESDPDITIISFSHGTNITKNKSKDIEVIFSISMAFTD